MWRAVEVGEVVAWTDRDDLMPLYQIVFRVGDHTSPRPPKPLPTPPHGWTIRYAPLVIHSRMACGREGGGGGFGGHPPMYGLL